MRAMQYTEYGGIEKLQLIECPKPSPQAGQLLIRVNAFSINPIDWKKMSGKMKMFLPATFPCTPCFDMCGVVEEIGEGVSGFSIGDRVFTREPNPQGGAAAEYAAIQADAACLSPQSMSDEECAAVPLAAQTALQGLRQGGSLQAGRRVLVLGASGGVGHFAVQIAHAHGAHVTGVCSTRNLDFVKSLGADQVIDYTQQKGFVTDAPFDQILDCVGQARWSELKPALHKHGRVDTAAPALQLALPMLTLPLYSKRRIKVVMLKANGVDMRILKSLIDEGKLKASIDQTFNGLASLPQAFEKSMSGRTRGKIVVNLQPA